MKLERAYGEFASSEPDKSSRSLDWFTLRAPASRFVCVAVIEVDYG
jgi:hypothetical protein